MRRAGATPSDAPLRVAQIVDHLGHGGVQTLLVLLAENARAHGLEIGVFALAAPADAPHAARLLAAGAAVTHLPARHGFELRRAERLARALRDSAWTVAHGHLPRGNTVGAWAAARAGVPFLGGLHLPGPGSGLRPALRGALEAVALRAGACAAVACAEAVATARRAALGRLPVLVATNPAPPPRPGLPRDEARAVLGGGSAPIFAFAGRLAPEKDLETLLRASALARDRGIAHRLALIGDGPERRRLEALADMLDLHGRLTVTGWREDVGALLAAADAAVAPGLTEGLSLAMLEAMAEGLPVIAADRGEAARADSVAWRFAARDAGALADAIAALAGDPGLRARLGAAGRAKVAAAHDADAWRARLADIYRRAAAGGAMADPPGAPS